VIYDIPCTAGMLARAEKGGAGPTFANAGRSATYARADLDEWATLWRLSTYSGSFRSMGFVEYLGRAEAERYVVLMYEISTVPSALAGNASFAGRPAFPIYSRADLDTWAKDRLITQKAEDF
jgi:hypothetical protein